ncbi:MAG: hypothetical protein KGN00_03005 [Chloroflexota bacterium]|nr:hypothetical protein [Chloroflexota bacterium]
MGETSLGPAALAAIVAAVALFAWPWSRPPQRSLVVAVLTFAGYAGWHAYLSLSNAANLDVDNPMLRGLSGEDIGSGVVIFTLATLALGALTARRERAALVVAAGAIAGVIAMLVDLYS